MENQPRSLTQITSEYSTLALKAGEKAYHIIQMQAELRQMYERMDSLNQEARVLKESQSSTPDPAMEASPLEPDQIHRQSIPGAPAP